jgi:hypothetical protein
VKLIANLSEDPNLFVLVGEKVPEGLRFETLPTSGEVSHYL